ncbi:MAG: hypothetical protein AAF335_04905, partial [Bacteroidota bacterium]
MLIAFFLPPCCADQHVLEETTSQPVQYQKRKSKLVKALIAGSSIGLVAVVWYFRELSSREKAKKPEEAEKERLREEKEEAERLEKEKAEKERLRKELERKKLTDSFLTLKEIDNFFDQNKDHFIIERIKN